MKITKRLLYLIIAVAVVVFSSPIEYTYAGVEDFIDKFAANNIMFYDPEACKSDGSSGSISLNVNDLPAETVEYLKNNNVEGLAQQNLSAYQHGADSAGIPWQVLAALHFREASMNPTKSIANGQSLGDGVSIDGQKIGNTLEEDAVIAANSIVSHGSVYGVNIAEDLNIDSLANSFLAYNRGSMYKSAGEPYTKSPYVMNMIDEDHMEMQWIHADSWLGSKQYNTLEGNTERRPGALAVFIYLGGSITGGGSSGIVGAYSGNGSDVTWIGDSISYMSDSQIKAVLPNADIYSQGSKHFAMDAAEGNGGKSGLTILEDLSKNNKVRDILVFALGTNDAGDVTMDKINKVLDLAKNAKQIIFVTNHTLAGQDDGYTKNNDNFKSAASSDSRVKVADWQAAVKGKETQYLTPSDNYVHPANDEAKKLFVSTILDAMNGGAKTIDECCDPADGSDGGEILFEGDKYPLSDGQLNGLMAIIKHENGGTINAIKFQASLMANLFEYKWKTKSHTPENLVDYVRTGGWFSTADRYDESYSSYEAKELEAVKDVLVNGRRSLPPEIVEHDDIGDIHHIENDGKTVDKMDIKNWVSGKTVVFQDLNHDGNADNSEGSWIFYEWANPNGTKISSSSGGDGTGDPFGYFKSNPPKGNGIAGGSVEACCDKTIGGVTKKTIDGTEYAFPLAGATQANYLSPSLFGMSETVLSNIPCSNPNGCHHDYPAVDMGIMMEMVTGKDPTAADYGGESGFSNMYYNSAGATVVAITSGTIKYVSEYTNGVPADWYSKCGQIALIGDDGNYYWMGHLDLASAVVSAGDHVEAGDELIKIGAPQCAQNTQSHLHIDIKSGPRPGLDPIWIVDLMNKLWEALPEEDTGTGTTTCGSLFGDLPAGGMTDDEAEKFMKAYYDLAMEYKGKGTYSMTTRGGEKISWSNNCNTDSNGNVFGPVGVLKNCVSFTKWFVFTYSTMPSDYISGNGQDIVRNLGAKGVPTGKEPKPYAVFSWSSGKYGHTGIVLGVNDDKSFIVGESSCSANWDSKMVGQAATYKLSSHDWQFAYIDEYLK